MLNNNIGKDVDTICIDDLEPVGFNSVGALQVVKVPSLNKGTKYIAALNPMGIDMYSKVSSGEFRVYMALASYVDVETGLCMPSQNTIAEKLGVRRETVNRNIKSLVKKGFLQIRKELNSDTKWQYNSYVFNDLSVPFEQTVLNLQESITDTEDTFVIDTAKDFVNYFCMKYEETYGVKYLPNYTRDCSIVKSRIIGKVSSEELKSIIDICFENYGVKWSSKAYPRPTIYPLTDWIGRECLRMYMTKKKTEEKYEELAKQEDDAAKFLDMFGGEE